MSGPIQFRKAELYAAMSGESVPDEDEETVQAPPRAPVTKKPAPKNIVALAKARLREAKAELRRLKKVEKEVAELERLIAAATKPKVDKRILREVKTNAG